MNRRAKLILSVLVVVSALAWLALPDGVLKPGNASPVAAAKPRPKVSVAKAQNVDLPVLLAAQGHVVPLNQVDVRSRVAATVLGVHFREGDDVRAGQLLFTLDAKDADAQLRRVTAQAANIAAQLEDAKRDQRRSAELVKSGFLSASLLDTSASKVDAFQAQWQAANAEIESARVLVGYNRIVAPIAAKAGAINVHPGSLAQPGDSVPLVSLIQFDPIAVEFSLPERNLAAVLAARGRGEVAVSIIGADGSSHRGALNFINNAVNSSTGTIALKAEFPNAAQALWPGAFVRVSVAAGTDAGVTVLPPTAVVEGPDGHFVFQVDADGKAASHPVTLLRIQDQLAVVEGLPVDAEVVVEGSQNIRSGMAVAVEPAAVASAGVRR